MRLTARAVVAMGFHPTVRTVKRRRTGTLGDLVLPVDGLDALVRGLPASA